MKKIMIILLTISILTLGFTDINYIEIDYDYREIILKTNYNYSTFVCSYPVIIKNNTIMMNINNLYDAIKADSYTYNNELTQVVLSRGAKEIIFDVNSEYAIFKYSIMGNKKSKMVKINSKPFKIGSNIYVPFEIVCKWFDLNVEQNENRFIVDANFETALDYLNDVNMEEYFNLLFDLEQLNISSENFLKSVKDADKLVAVHNGASADVYKMWKNVDRTLGLLSWTNTSKKEYYRKVLRLMMTNTDDDIYMEKYSRELDYVNTVSDLNYFVSEVNLFNNSLQWISTFDLYDSVVYVDKLLSQSGYLDSEIREILTYKLIFKNNFKNSKYISNMSNSDYVNKVNSYFNIKKVNEILDDVGKTISITGSVLNSISEVVGSLNMSEVKIESVSDVYVNSLSNEIDNELRIVSKEEVEKQRKALISLVDKFSTGVYGATSNGSLYPWVEIISNGGSFGKAASNLSAYQFSYELLCNSNFLDVNDNKDSAEAVLTVNACLGLIDFSVNELFMRANPEYSLDDLSELQGSLMNPIYCSLLASNVACEYLIQFYELNIDKVISSSEKLEVLYAKRDLIKEEIFRLRKIKSGCDFNVLNEVNYFDISKLNEYDTKNLNYKISNFNMSIEMNKDLYEKQIISASGYNSFVVSPNGDVYICGDKGFGGFNDDDMVLKLQKIEALKNIISISSSNTHLLAIDKDGQVWQMGNCLDNYNFNIVRVEGIKDICMVSAGDFFSTALRKDGTVWSWGRNYYGQLGNGNLIDSKTPQQVLGLSDVVGISSYADQSVALKSDGTVWTWGNNGVIKNGVGGKTLCSKPIQLPELTNIVRVSSGPDHLIALKSDGTLWSCGSNSNYQLGTDLEVNYAKPSRIRDLNDIIDISCGWNNTFALKSDGSVIGWGCNYNHSLTDEFFDVKTPMLINGLEDIKTISAGLNHTIAVKSDGAILVWGINAYGQMGNGKKSENPSFDKFKLCNLKQLN